MKMTIVTDLKACFLAAACALTALLGDPAQAAEGLPPVKTISGVSIGIEV